MIDIELPKACPFKVGTRECIAWLSGYIAAKEEDVEELREKLKENK